MADATEVHLIVVKNGRELPGVIGLDPGDQITSRYFDTDRGCHVVWVKAKADVPPSDEVRAGTGWDCFTQGHRLEHGRWCEECHELVDTNDDADGGVLA